MFRKPSADDEDGRITRHNRQLGDGTHCRFCGRLMTRDDRGYVICILCDRPNVALGMEVPE